MRSSSVTSVVRGVNFCLWALLSLLDVHHRVFLYVSVRIGIQFFYTFCCISSLYFNSIFFYFSVGFLATVSADNSAGEKGCVVGVPGVSGGRLVFAPTGPLDRDYDDARRWTDAARAGIKR